MASILETTARHFYRAAVDTDWESVAALLTHDFVVREAPGLAFGGEYHGLAALQQLGARVFKHFKHFEVEPLKFTAGEDSVAVWIRASGIGRQTGSSFDTVICEWLDFRDGQIASITPFYWDHRLVATI